MPRTSEPGRSVSSRLLEVLFAFGPGQPRQTLATLARRTGLPDPARLRRELAECRRTGTAIVREELTTEGDSVATRIMDGEGRVVAALSVVVRTGSVSLTAVVAPIVTSGLGISRRLGWSPNVGVRDGNRGAR